MKNRSTSRAVTASELKAHCSEVIDRVAKGRQTITIVRRGRAVAKLVPIDGQETDLFGVAKGCLTILGDIMEPIDVEWEAAK